MPPGDDDPQETTLGGGLFLAAVGGLLSFTIVVLVGVAILGAAFGAQGEDDSDGDSAAAGQESTAADSTTGDAAGADAARLELGESVYASTCSSCHGAQGEGGLGPAFEGIKERYPEAADHLQIVIEGKAQMPGFGTSLDSTEIEAVVAYEREVLDAG